jgi:Glycosyl transferase family 2
LDIEGIIVDGASTDATSELIHRYPQIKCIRLSESRGHPGECFYRS